MVKYHINAAGAKYGSGYCDSQCPRDLNFIAGEANAEGWTSSSSDTNAGTGNYRSCCNEMDIWEANKISAAVTPHPCNVDGLDSCSCTACGTDDRYTTVCDPDSCDFNSYRMGDTSFYGPGHTTQEVHCRHSIHLLRWHRDRRPHRDPPSVQNGVVIQNSNTNIPGMSTYNSITEDYCDAQKAAFDDETQFQSKGGLTQMGVAAKNASALARL
ncbi:hypothetical protein C0991_007832 [Blastosporella zonata]|nr:hypothetical protein C0991_007832 [Blastosporella zonata]